MNHRLIIVGAGGFGREVLQWVSAASEPQRRWGQVAFLDQRPDALSSFGLDELLIGAPASYVPSERDLFLCAIGDPRTKLRVTQSLRASGAKFTTFVHPTAIVGARVTIGPGTIVCPGAVLTTDATIGDDVHVNVYATIGHDVRIGRGCTLSSHVDVTGGAILEEGVFLGTHASVLPSVRVGAYATIGAGSVAMRNVPPGATVVGVPARKIFDNQAGGAS